MFIGAVTATAAVGGRILLSIGTVRFFLWQNLFSAAAVAAATVFALSVLLFHQLDAAVCSKNKQRWNLHRTGKLHNTGQQQAQQQ